MAEADERRPGRIDLLALGLFVLGLVVSLAVFSFEFEQAVSFEQSPGHAGRLVGRPALQYTRQHRLHVPGAWFVLVLFLLMRKSWRTWALRLSGWVVLLPCAAIAADYLGPTWLSGPIAGSGGALGAWLRGLLDEECMLGGRVLILGGSFAVGVLLAADFLVWRVFAILGQMLRGIGWTIGKVFARKRAAQATDSRRKEAGQSQKRGLFGYPDPSPHARTAGSRRKRPNPILRSPRRLPHRLPHRLPPSSPDHPANPVTRRRSNSASKISNCRP